MGQTVVVSEQEPSEPEDVDFIHIDVWVSMGEAKDVWAEWVRLLSPYQVNPELLDASANDKVKFMHCLPAFHDSNTVVGREIMEHTGMTSGPEVTGDIFESAASIVFDQAENRLHHQDDPRRHPRLASRHVPSDGRRTTWPE
jgi:ornithine carbamoyltransferase